MKKLFITFFLVLLVPSLLAADEFMPTKLKLTAAETIQYNFDGSTLTIPVTVTGTSARTWFFVYTKGKDSEIIDVLNGHLGWHWVTQLDTCVYMSAPSDFGTGQQTITWDGKDLDGNVIPKGDDYTYYMWAYDYLTPPSANQACPRNAGNFQRYVVSNTPFLKEEAEDGTPLPKPFFMDHWCPAGRGGFGEAQTHWAVKWTFGNDPVNPDLTETTDIHIPPEWYQYGTSGVGTVNYADHNIVYAGWAGPGPDRIGLWLRKFTWVPNDLCVYDDEWGYTSNECRQGLIPPMDDGNYLYWQKAHDDSSEPCSSTYILDYDANLIAGWQNDMWIDPVEYAKWGIILNDGPGNSSLRDSYIFAGTWYTVHGVAAPLRAIAGDDYPEMEAWLNLGGDYILAIVRSQIHRLHGQKVEKVHLGRTLLMVMRIISW